MLELTLDGEGSRQAQLQRALKGLLLAGHVRRLPGTRALATRLKLARNTVIAAYAQLEAEGYVAALPGSGFVARWQAPAMRAPQRGEHEAPQLSALARKALELAVRRPPPRRAAGGRERPPRLDLVYGVPLRQPALWRRWRQALAAAVLEIDPDYPPVAGLPRLRTALAGYLARRRGFQCEAAQIVMTGGAQQALDLCVRTLATEHTLALLEDPHYQGTRQVLVAAGVPLRCLPVDADGLDPQALPERRDCLLFLTPAHQFPRGCQLTLERRLQILAWAARTGSWVIEDDYDGEFRFDARPLAALKALDGDERVVYVGTLSKALFPALRMGFLVLPPVLVEACAAVKWLSDRGNAALEQLALARMIESGAFEHHLRQAGRALAARRAALLDGLQRHCGERVTIEGQAAGMHLTAWLQGVPATALPALLARAAESFDLGLYSIAPYFHVQPAQAGLLLGYAGLAPADLSEAAVRLARLLA